MIKSEKQWICSILYVYACVCNTVIKKKKFWMVCEGYPSKHEWPFLASGS